MKKIHLRTGKAISQDGFAETFNWLVDALSNFAVARPMKLDWGGDGAHPRIEFEKETGGGSCAWAWDPSAKTFKNAFVQVRRVIVEAACSTNLVDGEYYVHVNHESLSADVMQSAEHPGNTDDDSYFWIATISSGKQTRGIYSMPVCYLYE